MKTLKIDFIKIIFRVDKKELNQVLEQERKKRSKK